MAAAGPNENTPGRQPLTPVVRRRLQQCFERATQSSAAGQFDYASEMYTPCVKSDPGNPIYVQSFLNNLFRKYGNNKKGSSFVGLKGAGAKSGMKKAAGKQEWDGVIANGLEILKLNPWEISALLPMANACQEMGFDECQLTYLKAALDGNSKDVEVNRQCGFALARQGRFDEAILCWQRVLQVKPDDQEAKKQSADLTVEKTIAVGGYETAASEGKLRDKSAGGGDQAGEGEPQLSREEQLQKNIRRNPADLPAYVELGELYSRQEKFDNAIAAFSKGLEVSSGDLKLREMLEDTQMRKIRQELAVAEKRAASGEVPDAAKLLQRKKVELNNMELEVYRNRSERNPNNPAYKFELGLRLKRAGNFDEAIKALQKADNDPKRRGQVLLELGECFTHIKQYKLAMAKYEDAIGALPEREDELRKRSLYKAAVLAQHLGEDAKAEKYLTMLAGMDFGYRDVADRLKKLAEGGQGATSKSG